MIWLLASLTLLLGYAINSDGSSVVDICNVGVIKATLAKNKVVIVKTPSSTEKDCKPTFSIPANLTLDVSLVSPYVPKKTIGTEHHCVKVKVDGRWRPALDCSPDSSGAFYMAAYTKVIFRSTPRPFPTEASVEIPTWSTNFKILLELRPPLLSSWSFDSSVTRVVVEEEGTTMKCTHDNERLVPGIYHDGKFDKEMEAMYVNRAAAKDSGVYACDYGDKKDNQVTAITNLYRLVVAEKRVLTSRKQILNATVGDRYPLYCSVKFFVGSMKEMKSSDWNRIHDILAAQYRTQEADAAHVPSWLSLSRVSWLDITDVEKPTVVPDATGNLSLHTDDTSGGSVVSADLINVGDIVTPYFAVSKIVDVVVKEEDAGKKLTFRCHYREGEDEDGSIIGGISAVHVDVHVNALPTSAPLIKIDLTPTQIAIIAISLVMVVLIVIALVICFMRGLPGKGKNRLRQDNPLEGSNGWTLRTEAMPLNGSAPSPTTPTQDGILYQPRGPEPQLAQPNLRSDSPNGEVFFGSSFSSSPPKLPSPNANGAPYSSGSPTWPSLSRDAHRRSGGDDYGDHDVSLHNDTYGVMAASPNGIAVAT